MYVTVWRHKAKKHYKDFVSVVGNDIAPATLDKYYELKYNSPEDYKKLLELYKGFSSGKLVRNANGQIIKVVSKTTLRAEPNSITQFVNKKAVLTEIIMTKKEGNTNKLQTMQETKKLPKVLGNTVSIVTIMCMMKKAI